MKRAGKLDPDTLMVDRHGVPLAKASARSIPATGTIGM